MEKLDRAYSLKDACRFLGISIRTMRVWVKQGKVHASKIEGTRRWMITENEIRRLRGEKRNANEDRLHSFGFEES